MGARRNIIVEFSDTNSVALYTHWGAGEVHSDLAKALERGSACWDDAPYLTRIIFDTMVGDAQGSDLGFGIEPFTTGTTAYTEAGPGYDLIVRPAERTVEVGDDTFGFREFIIKFG